MITVYKPAEGMTHNPLRKFPRNHTCFCGSGKKFKHCCIKTCPRYVPKDLAEQIKERMKVEVKTALVSSAA